LKTAKLFEETKIQPKKKHLTDAADDKNFFGIRPDFPDKVTFQTVLLHLLSIDLEFLELR